MLEFTRSAACGDFSQRLIRTDRPQAATQCEQLLGARVRMVWWLRLIFTL